MDKEKFIQECTSAPCPNYGTGRKGCYTCKLSPWCVKFKYDPPPKPDKRLDWYRSQR